MAYRQVDLFNTSTGTTPLPPSSRPVEETETARTMDSHCQGARLLPGLDYSYCEGCRSWIATKNLIEK